MGLRTTWSSWAATFALSIEYTSLSRSLKPRCHNSDKPGYNNLHFCTNVTIQYNCCVCDGKDIGLIAKVHFHSSLSVYGCFDIDIAAWLEWRGPWDHFGTVTGNLSWPVSQEICHTSFTLELMVKAVIVRIERLVTQAACLQWFDNLSKINQGGDMITADH